ncbi:hypothetical protein U9M48_043417, partial [Paspalum notatum var. saurae]
FYLGDFSLELGWQNVPNDVNSAFLNEYIEEEICVRQPPDFEHPIDHSFLMGSVHKTLFLQKHGKDLLIVQIYEDDIIFGGVCTKLYFCKNMAKIFEMSMNLSSSFGSRSGRHHRVLLSTRANTRGTSFRSLRWRILHLK